jgi:hypothetical protein
MNIRANFGQTLIFQGGWQSVKTTTRRQHINKMAAVEAENSDKLRPGIIYFSRLPPFMKPAKVRYIFSQYGEIGRLFLQPEGIEKIALVFGKGVEIFASNYGWPVTRLIHVYGICRWICTFIRPNQEQLLY